MRLRAVSAVVVALLMAGGSARAQEISFGQAAAKKGHVTLASDDLVVEAGKAEIVELRFRVDEGFHINSHSPADALLIGTSLKVTDAAGVKVLGLTYPKGAAFKLGSGADAEVLDVYQGEFRVMVKLVAVKGASTLVGTLHYQACDNAACFPPRDLAVKVAVLGK